MVDIEKCQLLMYLKLRHVEFEHIPREIHAFCGFVVPEQHGYVTLEHVPGKIDLPKVHLIE